MEESDEGKLVLEKPIAKTIYSIEITNGYIFRQIFELYDRLIIHGIPVYFKETDVTIRTGTSGSRKNRKLISDIEIFTEDIIEYYLNKDLAAIPRNEEEETSACHIEQFSIETIRTIFKSIGKTSSVRIFKTTASDDVMIEIKGDTTEHSRLTSGRYQVVEYDISSFENSTSNPNIKIELGQFCTSMKGMTRGDTDYTSFKVYPSGLVVEGLSSNGTTMKSGRWGNIEETETFYETKVNSSVIKALLKISGMTGNSIIKVYSDRDGYLKLTHKIGDFGEHNIFLIDNS